MAATPTRSNVAPFSKKRPVTIPEVTLSVSAARLDRLWKRSLRCKRRSFERGQKKGSGLGGKGGAWDELGVDPELVPQKTDASTSRWASDLSN